jgi:hypothetical protein
MRFILALMLLGACGSAPAADLAAIDRTIKKEPKYAGQPRYCLLVIGPEAKDRVWLVQDGDTLYVDRNGNGDLTEAGEKVTAKKGAAGQGEEVFSFEAGELKVGGKTHKALEVLLTPLRTLAGNPNVMALPQVAPAVKKHPSEMTGRITLDVECASLKGGGVGGRVTYMVGLFDARGVFQLGRKPADAPIVHLDGPLQVTFFGNKPTWTAGRSQDTVLCVGTPGHGPGTFAMLKYEGTVPPGKHPTIDAVFRPKDPDGKAVKKRYVLKERC